MYYTEILLQFTTNTVQKNFKKNNFDLCFRFMRNFNKFS